MHLTKHIFLEACFVKYVKAQKNMPRNQEKLLDIFLKFVQKIKYFTLSF